MPKIHTHLHLGVLLNNKIEIENFESFLLGTAYPDCFAQSPEKALQLHGKKNWEDACNCKEFMNQNTWDSFTLGYFFHLWVDNAIQHIDLKDVTTSDCLLCDMEVLHDILQELNQKEYLGKEKEAMDNILTLDRLPMPLYLVDDEKKKIYHSILNELVERFIQENSQHLIGKFKKMRRFKQELSEQETIEIFKKGTSGTLALLDELGYPYAIPLSYVYHDGNIYFHSAKTGHKIDAIHFHHKASFCVIDQDQIVPEKYTTYFRSAIAFGKVKIIEEESRKRFAIQQLAEKYSYEYQEEIADEINQGFASLCMIQLTIEKMSGKEAIELVNEK